jgi:hypothetical protein
MPKVKQKLSFEQQGRLAKYAKETYEQYKKLNSHRHQTLLKIYRAFSTYEERRKADWQTSFKLNKTHEIVERVLPRLVAKNPRWICEPKIEDFFHDQELPEEPEQKKKEQKRRLELRNDYAKAIQAYLTYLFDEYHFEKPLRAYAKNLIVDGKARARICWKYELSRQFKKPEADEETGEIGEPETEEFVAGERPHIEVKSWTEVLTDPRYREVCEMPCYLELVHAVRWADIKRKKEYFNLDKVEQVWNLQARHKDETDYTRQLNTVIGVNWTEDTPPDKNALTLLKMYGYWSENEKKPEDEKMVEVTIIKELGTIIGYKQITRIPFVESDCFEDTQTNFSVGFVEPIMSLQDEMNFKKNSASEYVNQGLNRTWIWSEQSGIDPRDLISKPGNIIATTTSGPEAQANCVELPIRQLPSDYFQEQIDIERQIQGQTFTVDTSNPKGEQALTNTATGMRIEFFESNSVLDEVRKHYEQGLSELAYQLLQETFENMDENIVFKKMDSDEYWEMNKEALRDAVRRYTIKVEVNSSSFDDIENRRRDAIALGNILLQYAQAGVRVDVDKSVTDIVETFERRNPNDYLLPPDMGKIAQQMPGGGGAPIPEEAAQTGAMPPASELTEQVAGGGITSAIPQ